MQEIKLGQIVHQLREERGLSLRAVAERSGFSASFLSQVENDQASPSIASMERIAAALGVTMAEFFQTLDTARPTPGSEVDGYPSLRSNWSKARITYLSREVPQGKLFPLIIALDPNGSSGTRPYPAPSEEFAFVLEGSVVLSTGEGEQVLATGDSVTLSSGSLRRWHNASAAPVRLVIVAVR
jgi:XRE family transcriptional regulator, regulator of sulfur utilization